MHTAASKNGRQEAALISIDFLQMRIVRARIINVYVYTSRLIYVYIYTSILLSPVVLRLGLWFGLGVGLWLGAVVKVEIC